MNAYGRLWTPYFHYDSLAPRIDFCHISLSLAGMLLEYYMHSDAWSRLIIYNYTWLFPTLKGLPCVVKWTNIKVLVSSSNKSTTIHLSDKITINFSFNKFLLLNSILISVDLYFLREISFSMHQVFIGPLNCIM